MKTYSLPLGRIQDFPHPAPERTAYQSGPGAFSEFKFTVFPTRQFMLNCLQKSESMKALVKDVVPQGCVIHPNFQVEKAV